MVLLAPGVVPALPADGFLSLHLPDGFICLPLSPFIWPRLSPSLDACHGSLGWRGSFVSLCLPSFVSRCLQAWMPGTALWVDGFICHPLSPFICLPLPPSLDAWHGVLGGRVHLSPFVSLHLSGTALWALFPFICLPLSPSLDVWHGSPGGQIHLSPFVSLHLSPVVSRLGCLARLSGWTGSFVTLCLPSFVSRCLQAWMPGTALWVDGFICHHLSPFICLPLPPSLDAWHGALGGRVHLSPFVSLHLSGTALWALFPFICLPLSPSLDVWHGSPGGQIHLSPFVSLHLSPVVSQPGCLCLPSFGSPCLPAWMSVTALQADGFTCLPWFPFICLPSLWVDGLICLPLSPFICLPLSPSLDASLGGRIHLSPFVSLCLSRCLPAWMPGTALWVDGFICLPLSPSLDVWHSRSAVSFTSRGSVLLAGSGLPSASALASVIPCLVDVGDRVLCLPFIWTSILLGLVVGRLPCLSLATPCLFVQCLAVAASLCPCSHLESRADESGALRCTASATRRLC